MTGLSLLLLGITLGCQESQSRRNETNPKYIVELSQTYLVTVVERPKPIPGLPGMFNISTVLVSNRNGEKFHVLCYSVYKSRERAKYSFEPGRIIRIKMVPTEIKMYNRGMEYFEEK